MATTYNNLYLDLRTELKRAGDEEATQSARELVCAAAGKTREEFVRDGALYASPEVEENARALVRRHLGGERRALPHPRPLRGQRLHRPCGGGKPAGRARAARRIRRGSA